MEYKKEQKEFIIELVKTDLELFKASIKTNMYLLLMGYIVVIFTALGFILNFNNWLALLNLILVIFNVYNTERIRKSLKLDFEGKEACEKIIKELSI